MKNLPLNIFIQTKLRRWEIILLRKCLNSDMLHLMKQFKESLFENSSTASLSDWYFMIDVRLQTWRMNAFYSFQVSFFSFFFGKKIIQM